jgi:hypothetical protein
MPCYSGRAGARCAAESAKMVLKIFDPQKTCAAEDFSANPRRPIGLCFHIKAILPADPLALRPARTYIKLEPF